jgi:hypothetical protein
MTNILNKTGGYVRKAHVRAGIILPTAIRVHPKAIRLGQSGRTIDPVAYAAALEVLG